MTGAYNQSGEKALERVRSSRMHNCHPWARFYEMLYLFPAMMSLSDSGAFVCFDVILTSRTVCG